MEMSPLRFDMMRLDFFLVSLYFRSSTSRISLTSSRSSVSSGYCGFRYSACHMHTSGKDTSHPYLVIKSRLRLAMALRL